jgi:hypothetical protein
MAGLRRATESREVRYHLDSIRKTNKCYFLWISMGSTYFAMGITLAVQDSALCSFMNDPLLVVYCAASVELFVLFLSGGIINTTTSKSESSFISFLTLFILKWVFFS